MPELIHPEAELADMGEGISIDLALSLMYPRKWVILRRAFDTHSFSAKRSSAVQSIKLLATD